MGIYLLGISIILFILGCYKSKKKVVKATNGSVAVGGNNNGKINVNKNEPASNGDGHFFNIWNLLCGICSILGLTLTLWPIK